MAAEKWKEEIPLLTPKENRKCFPYKVQRKITTKMSQTQTMKAVIYQGIYSRWFRKGYRTSTDVVW